MEDKQANRPLQGTDEFFRSIFENAQIGIGIYNIQSGEHFSNHAMHQMLGYSQEELRRTEQWDRIVHPDEREVGAQRYAQMVQGKRDEDEWEQRFIRRDGGIVIAGGRFKLIRDAEGKPLHIVALNEDITERRRSAEALAASERLFRSIFENAQIGISFFNIDGRAVFTNRAFQEMLGYTEKELSQLEKWDEIIHPDERVSGAERYAALVQGKHEKDEWEQRFIRHDGRLVVTSSRFSLIRDEAGIPQYVAALTEDITESKRAQEERNRVTQQMQMLLESTGQGIYGIDLHGKCTFINRAASEMLGYSPGEALGQTMHDLIHHHKGDGSNYPAEDCPVYRALQKGEGCRLDTEVLWRRDGSPIPVEYSSFPFLEDGRTVGAVVTFVDITERKRSEENLRASEQLFRSIFEGAQVGIGVFKIDTKEHFSNRTLHEMLGYSGEELARLEQWDEIVPEEERELCAQRYAKVVQGKCEKDEYEQHFIRRDGHVLLGNSSLQLLRDSAGKPQCVVALTEDITERMRDKEALQASEQLFRSIFENAQIGISVVNLAAKKYHTNRALQDMLGRTHEELDSVEKWDQIVHPDERDSGAQRYAQLLRGERDNDEWEQRFVRPGGRIVIADGRFSAIRDAAGKPLYVLYMTEDVTDRKRAEAELVAAKEAAVAATRAKSDFLANMSHEIRTPMNAVLGMMHLALKTELTSRQRDYLTKAKAAADTLLGIINDILDFSKIEAGKLEMEHTEFRLDVVLADFSTVVSHKAHEKNLEFLVATEGNVPAALVGDPLRLGQVLINLVNNAVKFTERGEIVVTVKVQERVGDRVKLKFAVRDSGIGMTPDQTARLFQAFSQADTSTTRRYGGTGLGLSISKRFVEMMEGNIWVESEYGHGSTFCFTAWFGAGAAERRQKFIPPGLTGLRALVVDDNAAAREILSDILRQFTFRVECVPSGTGALRELVSADTEDPYRLVLMDWQMPGLDGLETGRRIKRAGTLRNVPKILGITAFDREDIRDQAQEIEIEGLLLKPVSPFVLFDMVMSIFGVAGEEEKAPRSIGKGNDLHLVRGIRVLLVEDNEVNQQVATELLESEGAIVTIANHGAEAVRILTQGNEPAPFDVVLMDLQMPEMDGLTATKVLRAQADLQQLPIIAMTAHVMADEVQRCLEAGMNDHVAKPIDPEAFFSTLARWTRAHQREIADMEARTLSSEAEIMLPEVEGVDVAAGLQRVAGNKRLYHDMLVRFAQKHGTTGDQIAVAIESGDRNHAANLAHSLKGVAGNLGINTISRLAAKLEQGIRQSLDDVQGMVNDLASALDRQAQNIQDVLKVATPSAEKREGSRSPNSVAVSAAVARLRELLEASNADSLKAYADLVEILQGAVDPSRLETLGAAVNAFRFEAALVKLDEIANQYGASHGEKKDA